MEHAQRPLEVSSVARTFREPLRRFFLKRAQDAATAEDLVQQVFERLIQRGSMEGIDSPQAYVFRVAENVYVDHVRRGNARHVAAHDSFDEAVHADVDFSPERVLASKERLARVIATLATLPDRTRIIFVLRRIEGWRYRDIAERYGISVSAVEKHVERAVAHLTAQMDDEQWQ